MNYDLMTASIKLSRKKAPMKISGMKNRTTRKLKLYYSIIIIGDHPSSVTVWNIVRRE